MTQPSWLTQRPIAHRGFHDTAAGRVENSLSAIAAAIENDFSIEVDIQTSADQIPIVFHDETLDRLTTATGRINARTAAELRSIQLGSTGDHIPTLAELLTFVRGRAGLFLELKSDFRNAGDLVASVVETLADYDGPVALMSFDPETVAAIRHQAPNIPRGIVACATSPRDPEWRRLTLMDRFILRHLLHAPRTRPDFVAYDIDALPTLASLALRAFFARPLLTWTVRDERQRDRAARWANQIIFEGFRPDA